MGAGRRGRDDSAARVRERSLPLPGYFLVIPSLPPGGVCGWKMRVWQAMSPKKKSIGIPGLNATYRLGPVNADAPDPAVASLLLFPMPSSPPAGRLAFRLPRRRARPLGAGTGVSSAGGGARVVVRVSLDPRRPNQQHPGRNRFPSDDRLRALDINSPLGLSFFSNALLPKAGGRVLLSSWPPLPWAIVPNLARGAKASKESEVSRNSNREVLAPAGGD